MFCTCALVFFKHDMLAADGTAERMMCCLNHIFQHDKGIMMQFRT